MFVIPLYIPEAVAHSCSCEALARSACSGEPPSSYREHKGQRYCVLHYPGQDKISAFDEELKKKFAANDYNFLGAWFPRKIKFGQLPLTAQANFSLTTFSDYADFSQIVFGEAVSFYRATFNGKANFKNTQFVKGANFNAAKFMAHVSFGGAGFGHFARFDQSIFHARADFDLAYFRTKADFQNALFGEDVNFRSATFFEGAYFGHHFGAATFTGTAKFDLVSFIKEAEFMRVEFSKPVSFDSAVFTKRANFDSAIFSADVSFKNPQFGDALNLSHATFAQYVRFSGDRTNKVFGNNSSLDLQFARIENAEHVSFHNLTLRPYWFVNLDPQEFDFTNINWDLSGVKEFLESLKKENVPSPQNLLAPAYRQLAINAEEHHLYEEASKFRYMAMDVWRLELLRKSPFWRLQRSILGRAKITLARLSRSFRRDWGVQARTFKRARRFLRVYLRSLHLLHWLYWLVSGYGERITWAVIWLAVIWLFAALLYTQVGFARWEPKRTNEAEAMTQKRDEVGEELPLSRALTYSLGVMTLQKPEPRPATTAAQSFVILETILGPLQAALLALAIRRKFMR